MKLPTKTDERKKTLHALATLNKVPATKRKELIAKEAKKRKKG